MHRYANIHKKVAPESAPAHLVEIASIFRSVLEVEADAYWCFERFQRKLHQRPLTAEVNLASAWIEAQDPELWKHLRAHSIDVRAIVSQWLSTLYTTYLPVSALERYAWRCLSKVKFIRHSIFDRLIVGSYSILAYDISFSLSLSFYLQLNSLATLRLQYFKH